MSTQVCTKSDQEFHHVRCTILNSRDDKRTWDILPTEIWPESSQEMWIGRVHITQTYNGT